MNRRALLTATVVILSAAALHAQRRYDPTAESRRLFEAYRPTIERKEQAAVDDPQATVGDLNGDGLADCILFFVLTPQGGGNAIIDRQAAVYLNTGKGMKVAGAFPKLDYCYAVSSINAGVIVVDEYECAPPYNTKTGTHRYRWQGGKLVAVR